MIISASYRTDIPAFYGQWFINRLRAGYCLVRNPYNNRPARVSLAPGDVDGFVFWTRNIAPFGTALEEVQARGFPFYVQYTITGYPRLLEQSVPQAAVSVQRMHELAQRFGPWVCVWRYDPILFTSLTPRMFHVEQFGLLAEQLRGATDEVVVSFAQLYRKSIAGLRRSAKNQELTWTDPPRDEKLSLLRELAGMARENNMGLSVCAQREYLVEGLADARCVDPQRLSAIAGRPISAAALPHRSTCGCSQSRDIGAYDTCPQGCAYCYAVCSGSLAARRLAMHDPAGEFLALPWG